MKKKSPKNEQKELKKLKIYMPQTDVRGSGPSVFHDRLFAAFTRMADVSVTSNIKDNFDAQLSFITMGKKHHNKPVVLRVDGCYYFPKKLSANKGIKESIKRASHVIFQSEFSKLMCARILNVHCKNTVIHNGIDMEYVGSLPADKSVIPGSFVCCAKWRHNKRPKSMINGFIEAKTGRHLYVIGGVEKENMVKNSFVHYLGKMSPASALSVMKMCEYQLHLCHIDSCPNAVVEGLACGLKVLCTNLGGTHELLKGQGVVLDVDRWDFVPRDMGDLDNLPAGLVGVGIHKLMALPSPEARPDLSIFHTAKQYTDVLKGVAV